MRTEQQIIEELKEIAADHEVKAVRIRQAIAILEGGILTVNKMQAIDPPADAPVNAGPKTLNNKVCVDCGKSYAPASNVQKRCEECRSKKATKPPKPPE